jgi:hypothetical protein
MQDRAGCDAEPRDGIGDLIVAEAPQKFRIDGSSIDLNDQSGPTLQLSQPPVLALIVAS